MDHFSFQPPSRADNRKETPFERRNLDDLFEGEEKPAAAETKNVNFDKLEFSEFERARHLYVIGRTGSGKSTFLEHVALADIHADKAVVFIDPHGTSTEFLLERIPAHKRNAVLSIDLSDTGHYVGFNPIEPHPHYPASKIASDIVSATKEIFFSNFNAPRFSWFLYNGLVALIENNRPLTELIPLYYDKQHRMRLTQKIDDPISRDFWHKEYKGLEKDDPRYLKQAQEPIINKIGQILASPIVRRMLSEANPRASLAHAFKHNQIVLVNLAKGKIGKDPAHFLGALLSAKIKTILFANDYPYTLSLIADEFQNYGIDTYAELISEGRKYGLQLTVAHQFTSQLEAQVRDAMLGNAGVIVSFSISAKDAAILAPELERPEADLTNQFPFRAWIRRGIESHHYILPPPSSPLDESREKTVKASRRRFSRAIASPLFRKRS